MDARQFAPALRASIFSQLEPAERDGLLDVEVTALGPDVLELWGDDPTQVARFTVLTERYLRRVYKHAELRFTAIFVPLDVGAIIGLCWEPKRATLAALDAPAHIRTGVRRAKPTDSIGAVRSDDILFYVLDDREELTLDIPRLLRECTQEATR